MRGSDRDFVLNHAHSIRDHGHPLINLLVADVERRQETDAVAVQTRADRHHAAPERLVDDVERLLRRGIGGSFTPRKIFRWR